MTTILSTRRYTWFAALVGLSMLGSNCKDKEDPTGLVPDAAAPAVVDAAPAALTDFSKCAGCSLAAQGAWTFEGIFRDDKCTDPLAQQLVPACAAVPAVGPASVTYVDAIGGRKAGETANVTVVEQIAPEVARFRKTATGCVKANESATSIAPGSCAGQKACRDPNGLLVCTSGCRTYANGCPDFEDVRVYASINDPAIKTAGGGGGGGNLARLQACCAALAAEGKRLGSSPEAGMINSAAAQCMTLVKSAGPNGNAPELGAIRAMLAGRNVPAVCAGF